ncbi:helicase C-terminal domain-containing protein [Natronobacterium gregoryi]|uniref:ATP-dependent DNA helicase n=2 Tax=Natronobacterium gregoryi TaxID=44930 RepID=L0AH08_NATGS|nr:ATP-dependent DNA helicase [Natronobacterium gregoryi]AFZ72704.1 DNA helicase, Rad3 [Natronobacterium gregoryi SP2]ELY69001.1 helicase c2 [Natronobacterium gregoryi SP2]PLK20656.1 ATP-dependent DNA helicase [Natronobacterium gregoryi SP2]SFI92062.1 Rad3-related DNA helicase [Natronobacterium gregoryi]
MNPDRSFEEFPAPSYRGNQESALQDIRDAFAADNDIVLVRAPTGSGKSLLARAVAGCARPAGEADPSEATGAYYTTPQVSQLDDVAADDLLADLNVIRGKSNYTCILPDERNTPVNQAPCVRERGYDCSVKHRCPYFSDRAIASNREIAAMTLAYFMQTAGSEVFRKRDVVVVDEAHGLAEWAEMYATIQIGPRTVPFWDDLRLPDIDDLERAVRYAENLQQTCTRRKDELLTQESLTPGEVRERDRLQELIGELDWFVSDYRDPQSPTTWLVDQSEPSSDDEKKEGGPLTVKPMNPEKYLQHTVWDRGNKFALLSATILNKDAFCRQVGLPPDNVALVDVGHTFPVENRPLYDITQGKMTYEHRSETTPKIARTIVRIMQNHPDEKGLVHAHSYDIQERLADRLADFGVGDRVRTHDRDSRDADLEAWKATDDPDVFLSVKMEEALDLKGDLCRFQVLCKAPFLNTGDSRVAHRLEEGQWAWYYRTALQTVIQACGRVVRAPDDHGATYLADSSLLDLFERAKSDMPGWFKEQVDRMSRPELPAFEPRAAVGETDSSSPSRTDTGSSTGAKTNADRSRQSRRSSSRASRSRSQSSPVADVWETDG